ncbi:MAG: FAD-binding oxidoreductase [Woeseiaceae bacterium]|nr:FAD-binding oxidoreductase [Woeseiaceae bacterium]
MLLERLKDIVGPRGWTTDPHELEPHLTEWRGVVHGATPIMVSPASVRQVADIVNACRAASVALVPQGGNTGLCAGAVPDASGEQVLLSLSRLNRIRSIDADDFSMTVDAGCVLADVRSAAEEAGRLFALSLGAEGSCQIGGNLATNAGGINVIRYGTARSQVLGLEVVLADGRVWNGLRRLRKDTAGYDLKQLFIGSEGTLGIITGASLKLFPPPGDTQVALLGLDAAERAVELLAQLRTRLGDSIQAFELIGDRPIRWVERHIPGASLPFSERHRWYALIEAAAADGDALQSHLLRALESGAVTDVVVAKNESEAEALWRIRHSISEAEKQEGACLKHDISVPIGAMADFLRRGEKLLADLCPDARLVAFGHVGDGNLHYNVAQPAGGDAGAFLARTEVISGAVYDLVRDLGGSISAEHGIGTLKKAWMHKYADPVEIDLMRTLKQALDPGNLLNPGKVI